MKITPARVASAIGVLAGIGGAVAPIVANADWASTAGIEAGALLIVSTVANFLIGQRQHETEEKRAATARSASMREHELRLAEIEAYRQQSVAGPDPDPAVAPEDDPPPLVDEDTDVPNPDPSVAKAELDDPEYKPRQRAKRRRR